jgi:MFS family permease
MDSMKGYRWLILSMGWLIYFSFGLINTAIAPLVAPVMGDLGITYTQMGVITGTWQLMYIVTAQPLGILIDRLGVYRSLLLGSILISISSLLRGFVSGFWDLFAAVALFGFGGPLVSIGTPKLISVWFSGEARGIASGINASG